MENTENKKNAATDADDFTKTLKWVAAKMVMIVHFVGVFLIFVCPWILYSPSWLLLTIFLNTALLTSWYMVGTCPLNYLENYLLDKKDVDQNGQPKNNFIYAISYLLGEHGDKIMYHGFSILPLACVSIACYKIFVSTQGASL
jgi:hypothetical protein